MTQQIAEVSSPIGIIAGSGVLPFAVADSLARRGVTPIFFALKGYCDPVKVTRFRHHWIPLGQFGAMTRKMRAENCRDLVFIGALVRPAVSDIRLDWGTLWIMPGILSALRGGDDHLLTTGARIFEESGFRLLGVKDVAPDLLMPPGCITRTTPSDESGSDIANGREVLRALSPFDIGQAVVVIDNHVVGVEDIEGTDGLLLRIARLRQEGRIRARPGRGVLVKGPKSGQDLRFDLPALGPKTIDGVAAAGLAGLAIEAGGTLIAEPQDVIAAADKAKLFVVGLPA